jgi:hypothetical protein
VSVKCTIKHNYDKDSYYITTIKVKRFFKKAFKIRRFCLKCKTCGRFSKPVTMKKLLIQWAYGGRDD